MASSDFVVRIDPFTGKQIEVPGYDEVSLHMIDVIEDLRSGETREKFPMAFSRNQSSSGGMMV